MNTTADQLREAMTAGKNDPHDIVVAWVRAEAEGAAGPETTQAAAEAATRLGVSYELLMDLVQRQRKINAAEADVARAEAEMEGKPSAGEIRRSISAFDKEVAPKIAALLEPKRRLVNEYHERLDAEEHVSTLRGNVRAITSVSESIPYEPPGTPHIANLR